MQPTPPDNGEVLEQFVQRVGGPTALANKVGVSFHAVFKWRKNAKVTDARSAILWAEALGVRVPPELRRIAGLPDEPEGGQPATVRAPESIDAPATEDDDDAVGREVRSTAASLGWANRRRHYGPPADRKPARPIQGILCASDDGPSKVARWLDQPPPVRQSA